MKANHKRPQRQLTSAELEMMNVIWRIGPCTVSQIVEQLRNDKELAYTTVSTIVRILEQKGFVASRKEGRGHLYAATLDKASYQATTLAHLVKNVFDGTPSLVVQRLLSSDALTQDEIAEIKALLRKHPTQ